MNVRPSGKRYAIGTVVMALAAALGGFTVAGSSELPPGGAALDLASDVGWNRTTDVGWNNTKA